MSSNFSPQLRWDQLRSSAVQNVVSSDEFFVDKFFDFSDQYVFEDPHNEEHDEDKQQKGYTLLSVSPQETEDCEIPEESFYVTEEFGWLSTIDLTIPTDDLPNLEWMSNFIDDSFSEQSATLPAEIWTEKMAPNPLEKETNSATAFIPQLSFKNAVHVKARSKRIKIGSRVWGDRGVVSFPKKIVFRNTKLSPAKSKIKSSVNEYGRSRTTQTNWRCSHCDVQETPLVRAGPGGSKTLCNACGIRYKSGRLLPEYRPSSSPTFTTELYSNHHLKVLEMRQKKTNPELPEHGFTPLVVDSVLL